MSTEKGYFNKYTLDELNEINTSFSAGSKPIISVEENINDDNEKWTTAYKTAAYYFDNPSESHRINAMQKFRFNFFNLLKKTAHPTELPDVRSRESFVMWVCKKHNEFLENTGNQFRADCNAKTLIEKFGPDHGHIKKILGDVELYI
jgi:hypothetical protein